MFGGLCSNAQYILSKQQQSSWISLTVGWAFAVTFAVYGGFNISGSHLNPAVSVFMFTMGHLSTRRLCVYIVAQTVGAFFGAALTFIVYYDALNEYDGGIRSVTGPLQTASIFATYPQPYLSVLGGFLDQVIGTTFLCVCVCILFEKKNEVPRFLQPLFVGFIVTLLTVTLSHNCGCAINPARDLGPRLFTLLAGWGLETFSFRNYTWFWIPIVGPTLGAVIGAWMYTLFLGIQIVDETEEIRSETIRSAIQAALAKDTKWKDTELAT
ncbi:unnamed protein product [Anisakis simplex]|uniref:Aquaporin-9 n=1 Tax=Anisakis simplex TaxID=6269 RepID=A0A0M3K962_ANISI|nr:unnamed protein product [Anisakis simplex]